MAIKLILDYKKKTENIQKKTYKGTAKDIEINKKNRKADNKTPKQIYKKTTKTRKKQINRYAKKPKNTHTGTSRQTKLYKIPC